LGPPERRLRRVSPPPFDYEGLPPAPAERAALALCTRSVSVADLLALPLPRPDLARGLSSLLVGGLLEDAPARVPAPPLAPAPGPSGVPAAPEVQTTPPPPPPQTPDDAERAARTLLENGFRQRAVAVLQEALDRHPEARGPRRLLAMTLAREGGFQPAVEKLFFASLEREPQDAELRYALASYYRRAGMSARAILQLRLVLSADSGHAAAWRDLGELEAAESRRGR
jgi:Flp pilus assembly protein TadD